MRISWLTVNYYIQIIKVMFSYITILKPFILYIFQFRKLFYSVLGRNPLSRTFVVTWVSSMKIFDKDFYLCEWRVLRHNALRATFTISHSDDIIRAEKRMWYRECGP